MHGEDEEMQGVVNNSTRESTLFTGINLRQRVCFPGVPVLTTVVFFFQDISFVKVEYGCSISVLVQTYYERQSSKRNDSNHTYQGEHIS